jgi:hypothetical protein
VGIELDRGSPEMKSLAKLGASMGRGLSSYARAAVEGIAEGT